jgi:Domain of unknown function (DUF4407)
MMGIMILTTAAVGAVSCAFALHVVLNVGLWPVIPLGVAWGAIVVSIDRFMVFSVRGERGEVADDEFLRPKIDRWHRGSMNNRPDGSRSLRVLA